MVIVGSVILRCTLSSTAAYARMEFLQNSKKYPWVERRKVGDEVLATKATGTLTPIMISFLLPCYFVPLLYPFPQFAFSISVRHLRMYQSSSMLLTSSLTSSQPLATGQASQATAEPFLAPNIKQYSSSVSLYSNPSIPESERSSRPLLLFLPWLGSKAKAFERYIDLYFKLGFDVLVAESSLSHFLWPRRGLDYAGQLVNLLMKESDLCSRNLFVHAMSIGGYTFTQMLVSVSKGHEEQETTLKRIRGQVFDSLVVGSMEKMAKGVAGMVGFLQPLVVRGTLLYFSLLKSHTADYYDNGIHTFWNTPITCPALFFYCMNDPLSDHGAVEQIVADWKKQGIRVESKKWENSLHAGHLRRHPQEYIEVLSTFISSLHSTSPRSKL
ncbi:transmembrane protein 53-like [Pelodytes ibericus]